MAEYESMEPKLAGLAVGIDIPPSETLRAVEPIDNGKGVFVYEGDEVNGYNVKQDTGTITLDADLVTDNVITTTLTIDGVAQTPVETTWDTDHNTTMANHEADLEAAFPGLEVTLTDLPTPNRVFELFWKGKNIQIASVITLGGSQAGITIAYTNSQIYAGIARFDQKSYKDSVGVYVEDDAISVQPRGKICSETSVAVNAHTRAYIIWQYGANQGKFTNVATNNYDVNCWFRDTIAAAGLAIVETNGLTRDATP